MIVKILRFNLINKITFLLDIGIFENQDESELEASKMSS